MAKTEKKSELELLVEEAAAARAAADEAVAKATASAEPADQDAANEALLAAQKGEKAVEEFRATLAEAQRLEEERQAKLADEARARQESGLIPVITDEDGERIPKNSILRVRTTTNYNLKSLDGTLVTPTADAEFHGPDIRKGDWLTTQFEAGLIVVDNVKKLK